MKEIKNQVENTNLEEKEILKDISSTGRENPWKSKKEANQTLASVYECLGLSKDDSSKSDKSEYLSKAERLDECASYLEFKPFPNDTMKLHTMNSCRVRLCPVCAWRRSLKVFAHTIKIMGAMNDKDKRDEAVKKLELRIAGLGEDIEMAESGVHADALEKKITELKSNVADIEAFEGKRSFGEIYDKDKKRAKKDLQKKISALEKELGEVESGKYIKKLNKGISFATKSIKNLNNMPECDYVFITLTRTRCSSERLSDTIDDLLTKVWHRFINDRSIKKIVKGWHRGFEIAYDSEPIITKNLYKEKKKYFIKKGLKIGDENPDFDTYNCHFHCIFAVDKKYFKSVDYKNHEKWVALWQRALQVDYEPHVEVKKVYGNLEKGVAEITKYSVKETNYIIPNNFDLSLKVVKTLDKALNKRRFVAYGGLFKDLHNALNLDDEEEGDLIHIDSEKAEISDNEEQPENLVYIWYRKDNQYYRYKPKSKPKRELTLEQLYSCARSETKIEYYRDKLVDLFKHRLQQLSGDDYSANGERHLKAKEMIKEFVNGRK